MKQGDLQKYWQKVFPWDWFERRVTWAEHSVDCCEVAFTQRGFFRRNTRFHDIKELRRQVIAAHPTQLDIGAWYPDTEMLAGDRRGLYQWIQVEAPLQIDVDVTDYRKGDKDDRPSLRDVLPCHHEIESDLACVQCWELLLKPAARALQLILRDVLGVSRVLLVASGKKGFHLTVFDKRVLQLTPEARQVLSTTLSGRGLDPDLRQRLHVEVYEPAWQRALSAGCRVSECIRPLLDHELPPGLGNEALLAQLARAGAQVRHRLLEQLFAPRIDKAITCDPRHLLKGAFMPHNGTGRLSLPIMNIDTFHSERDLPFLVQVLEKPDLIQPHVKHALRLLY